MNDPVARSGRASTVAERIAALPRGMKRGIMLVADAIAMPAAAAVGLWLVAPQALSRSSPVFWLAILAFTLPIFHLRGLYRPIVHFMGLELIRHAVEKALISSMALLLITSWIDGPRIGIKFAIVFWLSALTYLLSSRFIVRLFLREHNTKGDHVLIYGAGDAGAHLASALSTRSEFTSVGFVDDNFALQGTVINGLEVYAPAKVSELIDTLDVSRVLLAMPTVARHRRRQILNNLEQLPVHVQTMPDVADLIAGHARVDEIREVDVADLLGRDAVPPMEELLDACIRGKSVMVTGAGGSIGAELCRQIIRLSPRRLILLEISEVALYRVHRALADATKRERLGVELVPVLASTNHRPRASQICSAFEVETIYHAAAYKHVPLVEHNMVEGIYNNVFGTLHTAEAAIESGVESFVLVSTDKAVQPTNVMGATKRLSELVLQALSEQGSGTRFSMVRFGNVLASSGSVVPLFREQIRNGGPVTVTHPDIYRFFMTIPEAAELVIQAGSMARGGDVFVLDMGKPVRISDLAEKMIHLMGLSVRNDENPDGDIEIEYTGLRPAEKLCEELLIGSDVRGTEHSMIMRAVESFVPWEELQVLLDELWAACLAFDCEKARELLVRGVGEYAPSVGIVDYVWTELQDSSIKADQVANVTELHPGRATSVSSKIS